MRAGKYSTIVTLQGSVRNGGVTRTITRTLYKVIEVNQDKPRSEVETLLLSAAERKMRIDHDYETGGLVVLFLSIEPE